MKIIGIIPARYASTRFPGKPLVDIGGKTMVRRVYERASESRLLNSVVVATDDERIADEIRSFGGKVVMTSKDHPSGTDRCLEALQQSGDNYEAVINVQGDEPFVDPRQIDDLCELIAAPAVQIATLARRITDTALLHDPNKVKVVTDDNGRALYFSRQAIPFVKDSPPSGWIEKTGYFKHIGLYAYKTTILHEICKLGPSALELAESLEQLRWLQHGYSIHVAETNIETPAIDTPEDLARVLASPGSW